MAGMTPVFTVNHIYPSGDRRTLIQSHDFDELSEWATDKLDDQILVSLFRELEEWHTEGRTIAEMSERLSSSLELIISYS